jgi:hypothetical protein
VTTSQLQQFMPLLFLLPVVALIIFRNLKPRPLRLELLWIRPVIIMAVATSFLIFMPFPHQGYAIPLLIAAFAVGAGLGWLRGRMVRVQVDPATHMAMSQSSPLGVIFILGIIGVRFFLRSSAMGSGGAMSPQTLLITDTLMLLAVGLVAVSGLEVWVRARKMIADSRARAGTVAA